MLRKLAAIVFVALVVPSAATAAQATNGQIVFTSTTDGNEEIYAMIRRSKSLIERVDALLGRKKDQDPPPQMVR